MQTHLGKLPIVAATLLYSTLFYTANASQLFGAFPLIPRDQTCPDGNVCLSNPGFICCPSSESRESGCMWAGNVCCGTGVFCGPNQFCSPPDNGSVNCCFDSACNTVVYSGGIEIIPYTDQSLFTSSPGAAATATATTDGATGEATTTGGETTNTAKTGTTSTNSSPAPTKTSAGDVKVQVDMIAGLLVPLFTVVWILLGA